MATDLDRARLMTQEGIKELSRRLKEYHRASTWRSAAQLAVTAALFVASWVAMWWSLDVSYWLTLLLSLPTAGMVVRLFIIQHDCGHGSFFKHKALNDAVGGVLGVLTLTPYRFWMRTHAFHHTASGDLERRGIGDIWMMTVQEYMAAPRLKRLWYRIYHHPVCLLGIGPLLHFGARHRLPLDIPRTWRRERWSVWINDAALAAIATVLALLIGWKALLAVHLPVMAIASSVGVWLFYVQHQFDGVYWRRRESWSYGEAALLGSSYYELPAVLRWLTADIGVHHVHHLDSRIPNYRLREVLRDYPSLRQVNRLTLRESLRCLSLKLWDEQDGRLVSFKELRRRLDRG